MAPDGTETGRRLMKRAPQEADGSTGAKYSTSGLSQSSANFDRSFKIFTAVRSRVPGSGGNSNLPQLRKQEKPDETITISSGYREDENE